MAEFPALPLWTDAYLADTRHLSAAQHGAYFLLLMSAWRTTECALPDDDAKLARWASMDKRTWGANKDAVMSFWTRGNDGLWRQGRLTDERKYVAELSDKNSKNAKARWLKTKGTANATALPDASQPDAPTPTPTPIEPKGSIPSQKRAGRKVRELCPLPEGWEPTERARADAGNVGWSAAAISYQVELFKDHARQKDVKNKDWDAAFRTWLRKAEQFDRAGNVLTYVPPTFRKALAAMPSDWPSRIKTTPDEAFKIWTGKIWPANWGPEPGQPGCVVPQRILTDWNERTNRREQPNDNAKAA